MADWVRCKSLMGDDLPIFVNLDQVVSMIRSGVGTEITYAGQGCTFYVAELPEKMLGGDKVRNA